MNKKTQLTKEEVLHVANLIKIRLKQEEVSRYQDQLTTVLDSLDVFNELDTKDVKITSQVTGLTNVFREDEPEESLSQDDALSNAKNKAGGYFVVKKVIRK